MRFAFVLLAGFWSAGAGAGNWGSSGNGEFLRDSHNPWFVKGVSEVRYCLEVDQEGFSTSPEKIRGFTEKAMAYWREEFTSHSNVPGVGTQKFTLTNQFPAEKCVGNEDLKIQFGYGTLSEAQRKEFSDHDENPQDYVGIAIRTEYDKTNLKGKGFVFISSDRGTHPYNAGNGIAKDLWNHDGLLFRVLQHELGHVFGVSHTDSGFMAADFPENMVRNYRPYRTLKVQPFFSPKEVVEICATDRSIPIKDVFCLRLRSTDLWRSFVMEAEMIGGGAVVPLGKSLAVKRVATKQQFPVKVFLPDEQKIFPKLAGETVIRGPARQEYKLLVDFEEANGTKSKLLIDMAPADIEVYRAKDGNLERWF